MNASKHAGQAHCNDKQVREARPWHEAYYYEVKRSNNDDGDEESSKDHHERPPLFDAQRYSKESAASAGLNETAEP